MRFFENGDFLKHARVWMGAGVPSEGMDRAPGKPHWPRRELALTAQSDAARALVQSRAQG